MNDNENRDAADISDILIYAKEAIEVKMNEAVLVLTPPDVDAGSFVCHFNVGPNGELPFRKNVDHNPDQLLEQLQPLLQTDGSINRGFAPKADCDLKVPGVIVNQYLAADHNVVVATAVVVVLIVNGLDSPIVRQLTPDLLEKQPTMAIQHAKAYVAYAAKGAILQLEVPQHSGYSEKNQERYGTVQPVGALQVDNPEPPNKSDNALRYFVFSNAPKGSVGAIEDDFDSSAGDSIIDSPTVVVVFPEDGPESSLYLIDWERLLPKAG